jgi:hypothetical protein
VKVFKLRQVFTSLDYSPLRTPDGEV